MWLFIHRYQEKERYDYYYCTNGKGVCPQHSHYLESASVKDLLSVQFASFSLPETLATASLSLYTDDLKRQTKTQDYASQALTKDLETINRKLTKLEDMFIDELITKDRYLTKRNGLVNQQAEIKSQLKQKPQTNLDITLEQLEEIKDQAVNLGEMFQNGDDEVRNDL